MLKLLIRMVIPPILGISVALILNFYRVSLFEASFHPETNWFLVGIGILVVGLALVRAAFNLDQSGAQPELISRGQDKGSRLAEMADRNRGAWEVKTGFLWLGWGAIFIAVTLLVSK